MVEIVIKRLLCSWRRPWLLAATLLWGLLLGNSVAAQGLGAEMESLGQIDRMVLGEQQMVVDGRTYSAGPGLQVEIAGTYGAFTLLQPGMRVYLRYLQHNDGRRELLEVRELPANQRLQRS